MIFFSWLVGPCQVKDSEWNGKKERSVVFVPKCRFLEGTECVGMCTNLCKMPSQAFIKESLGMPINMVPNIIELFEFKMWSKQRHVPMQRVSKHTDKLVPSKNDRGTTCLNLL